MARLEDLRNGASVKAILPDCLFAAVGVKWRGSSFVELIRKSIILVRDRVATSGIGVNLGAGNTFCNDRLVDHEANCVLAFLPCEAGVHS